jgi:hypothetical protein
MADDLTKRGRQDRERISLVEGWEVRRWCDKLDVTEVELRHAVDEVGHMADDVEAYLASGQRAD